MTRKEEINDFIAYYLEQYNGDSYEAYAEKEDIARACQSAIEWATSTMLDKVCEWLKSYRQDSYDGTGYIAGIVNDKTIEDLRKAMEK